MEKKKTVRRGVGVVFAMEVGTTKTAGCDGELDRQDILATLCAEPHAFQPSTPPTEKREDRSPAAGTEPSGSRRADRSTC